MIRRRHLLLTLILLLGAALRCWHLDWGTDPFDGVFQLLHPDEESLVRSAGDLQHSLRPTISAYGALALYMPWMAGLPLSWLTGIELFDFSDPQSTRFTFLVARGLSAVAAIAALLLTWRLGLRLGGLRVGLLSAALLAVALLPVQQAHYYTVDSTFTAATLIALLLIVRLPDVPSWRSWFLLGASIGVASALRINALSLFVPALVGALIPHEGSRFEPRSLPGLAGRLTVAVAAALTVSVVLQPYVILDPNHYFGFGADSFGSLRIGVAVATGDTPRIYMLYDSAQTPVIFHLKNLLFYGMGPALQGLGLAGALYLARRHARVDVILLAWALTHLALLSRLEPKNIRYLLPLVPILCLAAASLLDLGLGHASRRWRRLAVTVAGLTLVTSAVYTLSVLRVYDMPDSRLVAAHQLPRLFPGGATIGFEAAGASFDRLVPPGQLELRADPVGQVFNLHDFILAADQVLILGNWLAQLDGIATVDVARRRHFAVNGRRYPVLAEYYRRLLGERLGFAKVAEYRTDPMLGPWPLDYRADTEPSFYGFDHPEVTILRRRREVALDTLVSAWVAQLRADPDGLDYHVLRASRALRMDRLDEAEQALAQAMARWPQHHLPRLLQCELLWRRDQRAAARELWDAFFAGLGPKGVVGPWDHEIDGLEYAGRTLLMLGADVVGRRCTDLAARLR